MPDGYESPLNRLADALPNFILQMQDMKMRQETQEAMNSYRTMMLTERINAREAQEEATRAMEQMGRLTGRYDPPEVDVLSKRIEKDLDIIRDLNTALTLGAEEINAIKNRVKSNLGERRRLSGREYYVDPSLIRIAPKEPDIPEPPLAAPPVEPVVEGKPKPRLWESRDEYQARLKEWEGAAPPAEAPAVEEVPPEFPEPSGFQEGQTATFNGEPWIIRNGQWVRDK